MLDELTTLVTEGGNDIRLLEPDHVLPRFAAALLIGIVLGVRPWRPLMRRSLPAPQMMQAEIILCAAAAIITMVIGHSVAKAFGLVGLGSFVRFRSGLKDPRDAAVLYLIIGLGMAAGHGDLGVALSGAAFSTLVLAGLDLFNVPDGPAVPSEAPEPAARPDPGASVPGIDPKHVA